MMATGQPFMKLLVKHLLEFFLGRKLEFPLTFYIQPRRTFAVLKIFSRQSKTSWFINHNFLSVRSKSALGHRRQKLTFHKKNYGPSFKEQDLVLLHSRKRSIDKLKSHWSGPYVIKKKINDANFIVQNSNYRKKSIVH